MLADMLITCNYRVLNVPCNDSKPLELPGFVSASGK